MKLLFYSNVIVRKKIWFGNRALNRLYAQTLNTKHCYYGPFTGEFGHLLGHNLPFIAHLYSKGVRVEFCGMEIHRPFFLDENGNEIVSSYLSVRDFFKESLPDCNNAIEPDDVGQISDRFIKEAKRSKLPYWDLSDKFFYFQTFRWWALRNKHLKVFDLSKVYKTADEDSIVIFPRKRNLNFSIEAENRNNGEAWDYLELAKTVSKYFEKVYVIGHPSFSIEFESFDNVEVTLTNNNAFILEKCSNSKLIISQHSGSVYIGEYTNTPVLVIYKGGRNIGDMDITTQFKNGLGRKHDFNFAFSLDEIEQFITKKYEAVRN